MKEPKQDMPKNTFAVVSVACFFVLCFVTFFNTYRMLVLEAEVHEMRANLEKFDYVKTLDENRLYVEKLNQYITRKRRNILDQNDYLAGSETIDQPVESSSRRRYPPVFESLSSLNTIFPHQKGGSTKSSHVDTIAFNLDEVKSGRRIMKRSLKSLDSSSYEYNTGSSETESRDQEVISRPRARMQTLDERHPRTGRIKPLPSIHLSGDTSKYVLGTHQNFNGNGHLRHLQSIFVDWEPSSWVEKTGMMSHFEFDQGYLTIKGSGLYLIYAQIYYLDEHDMNGYRVYKNDNTILQCTVSLHSGTRAQKGNTCYTAGVEYVAEGDRISLGDILNGHYSLFEPGKSFFGAVKLGDVRARI